MQNQIDILHEIKELYNSHSLSVMVGAGFSLNAMKDYPLWDNMLYDLTYELYKNEIEEKWNLQFHTLISANKTHDSFVKENIYEYIHKIGYLNIVSEFIHKKGYREAIDYYIEEHMPLIMDDGNNGLIKRFKGKDEPFDKSNLQTHRELLMCDNWRNVYTTNYDNLLDITAKTFNMDYEVCDKDYKLSKLGNNKGIIKIHGSLAHDSLSDPFEFDNDKNIRYIISKEDYDTYAAKHQAFSYLMRTSLLINSFLLIGFSGNDPNFLGWLEWMKDVLDKDINSNDKENKAKVYLVTIDREEVPNDRKLFYRNHRIKVFNILNQDIEAELFKDAKPKISINIRDGKWFDISGKKNHSNSEIFTKFFEYLRNDAEKQEKEAEKEVAKAQPNQEDKSNAYDKLWSKVKSNPSEDLIKSIRAERTPLYMPKDDWYQKNFIDDCLFNDKNGESENQLLAIAINDFGLLPDIYKHHKRFVNSSIDKEREFEEMIDIQNVLTLDGREVPIDSDEEIYLSILFNLYRLNFTKAKDILNNWKPSGHWNLYKGILIADFNLQQAKVIIDTYIGTTSDSEYKYRASIFGNIFSRVYPFPYSYNEFKQKNIKSLYDISNKLLDDIERKSEKLLPYGATNHTINLNPFDKSLYAIKYLVFLVKTGFRIGYTNTIILDAKKWYEIFHEIYKFLPYPCLYYSLQVTDEKTLTRIGQDYAYSLETNNILPDIIAKLLHNISTEPIGFPYDHALNITKELFIAVNEDLWFDTFYEIYTTHYLVYIRKIGHNNSIDKFVDKALDIVAEDSHLISILNSTLEHISDNSLLLSERLYNCGHLKNIKQLPSKTTSKISEIVTRLPLSKSYLLLALLKKNKWITNDIKRNVSKQIKDNQEEIKEFSFSILHTLTYLTNKDPETIAIIKGAILSKDIWNCGLEGNGGSMPNYLSLSKICKDIVWTKEELDKIISNIKDNLSKMENTSSELTMRDEFFRPQYVGLLSSMLDFVAIVLPKYYKIENEKLISRIEKDIEHIDDYSIEDKIQLYDLDNNISSYIQYLAKLIDANGISKYTSEITLLINRILLMIPINLNLELSFVEWILRKHGKDINGKNSIVSLLYVILIKYQDVDYVKLHLDLPMALQSLNYIAEYLKDKSKKKEEIQIVDEWINDPNHYRFNEVVVY